jgi:polyhydroxybutyrate depolymerase
MKKIILWLIFIACISMQAFAVEMTQQIKVGKDTRSYQLFVPSKISVSPMPLVLVFHGAGGNASAMSKKTHFNRYAERDGVMLVYLQGENKRWNDGRIETGNHADDLGFVKALLVKLKQENRIDAQNVYAVGHSNGGMFTQHLGAVMADQFKAIASVAGPMPAGEALNFKPIKPLSVLLIHGIQDPIVPYQGGVVARSRGEVASVKTTANLWRSLANLPEVGNVLPFMDPDKNDACTVHHQQWALINYRVELISLDGAGHDWPSTEPVKSGPLRMRLAEKVLGPSCHSLDASKEIWRFFFKK